jgi:hypothetical protein
MDTIRDSARARNNNRTCEHCGGQLPLAARRHARFCCPAHRAAHHRTWPGMHRLKRADGSLSDMVNLTRARDALASLEDARQP